MEWDFSPGQEFPKNLRKILGSKAGKMELGVGFSTGTAIPRELEGYPEEKSTENRAWRGTVHLRIPRESEGDFGEQSWENRAWSWILHLRGIPRESESDFGKHKREDGAWSWILNLGKPGFEGSIPSFSAWWENMDLWVPFLLLFLLGGKTWI